MGHHRTILNVHDLLEKGHRKQEVKERITKEEASAQTALAQRDDEEELGVQKCLDEG